MRRSLKTIGIRINLDKVKALCTCKACLVHHHAELVRSQTAHVLRPLRHACGIQRIRANCDIDKVCVFKCQLNCLVYACLPAVLLNLSAKNHICAKLLRIVELLLMVSRSADADVNNLGGIHIRVLIEPVER